MGAYPAKGGFLGLLQTAERIISIGTFSKDSDPVCYIEKATIVELELTQPEPITEPTPEETTPSPTPSPTPTPTPTPIEPISKVTLKQVLAEELEVIAGSFVRIANYLRSLVGQ